MLFPKRQKFRKRQRGRLKGMAKGGIELSFGSYGIKAVNRGWVSSRQIEAARRTITHFIKRGGKIWIRVFPDKPVTYKGVEVSMGGGKGEVIEYTAPVKPGRVLFEMDGVSEEVAREALRRASHKLSVKTKFISRA